MHVPLKQNGDGISDYDLREKQFRLSLGWHSRVNGPSNYAQSLTPGRGSRATAWGRLVLPSLLVVRSAQVSFDTEDGDSDWMSRRV